MIGTRHPFYYEFPTVITKTKAGKNSYSTIFCGLVKMDIATDVFKSMKDVNGFSVLCHRIQDSYFDNSLILENIKAFYVVSTRAEGKPHNFKAATFILVGKNLGKTNQTNIWTQVLANALSKYHDKNRTNECPELIRPMLASGKAVSNQLLNNTIMDLHNTYASNYHIQHKFDGHRMVVRVSDCYAYSRTAEKTHISNSLADELLVIKQNYKLCLPAEYKNYKIYLDGEYYLHEKSLQSITSAIRSEQQSAEKDELIYHIFDIPMTLANNSVAPVVCVDRLKLLRVFREYFAKFNFTKIIFIGSTMPKNAATLKASYLKALKDKYEGLIFRIDDRLYEPGHNDYHSSNIIKIKELLRDEFLIVGFKTGKGKAEGKIILTCVTTEKTIQHAGEYLASRGRIIEGNMDFLVGSKFNVTPKLPDQEKIDLYNRALEDNSIILGKLYTVEFTDWSNACLPLRGVGISLF